MLLLTLYCKHSRIIITVSLVECICCIIFLFAWKALFHHKWNNKSLFPFIPSIESYNSHPLYISQSKNTNKLFFLQLLSDLNDDFYLWKMWWCFHLFFRYFTLSIVLTTYQLFYTIYTHTCKSKFNTQIPCSQNSFGSLQSINPSCWIVIGKLILWH